MEIVVNEWLLDYMCPGTQQCKADLADQFVDAWESRCDKLLIRFHTPFFRKFHGYMERFHWSIASKRRLKRLRFLFYNSNKTRIIDDNDVTPLSPEVQAKTHHKDIYLIELAYCSPDRIVITTDERLKESLKDEEDLTIYSPDEFLSEFSPRPPGI